MGLSLLPTPNITCAKLLVATVAAVPAMRLCYAVAVDQMVTTGPASPLDERLHEQALGLHGYVHSQLWHTATAALEHPYALTWSYGKQ